MCQVPPRLGLGVPASNKVNMVSSFVKLLWRGSEKERIWNPHFHHRGRRFGPWTGELGSHIPHSMAKKKKKNLC